MINRLMKTTLEETVTQTMKSKALQKKVKKLDKSWTNGCLPQSYQQALRYRCVGGGSTPAKNFTVLAQHYILTSVIDDSNTTCDQGDMRGFQTVSTEVQAKPK